MEKAKANKRQGLADRLRQAGEKNRDELDKSSKLLSNITNYTENEQDTGRIRAGYGQGTDTVRTDHAENEQDGQDTDRVRTGCGQGTDRVRTLCGQYPGKMVIWCGHHLPNFRNSSRLYLTGYSKIARMVFSPSRKLKEKQAFLMEL